jgi:hypothetical protein
MRKFLALALIGSVTSAGGQGVATSTTLRVAIGAPPDSRNQLLVRVRDAATPTQTLGSASVTVTRVGADSIGTATRWDARSRADGLAAFVLPDSGVYEITVRLIRRTSFRQRLRLTAKCRQSLDIFMEETALPLTMPSRLEAAPRSRGILTTCDAPA